VTNSIQVLAEHAAATLPDSIIQRKRVLRAVQVVLPDKHPAMRDIRSQLLLLDSLDSFQEKLPLKFKTQ